MMRKIIRVISFFTIFLCLIGEFNLIAFGKQIAQTKPNKNLIRVIPKPKNSISSIDSQKEKSIPKVNNNKIPKPVKGDFEVLPKRAQVQNVNTSLRVRKGADLTSTIIGYIINGQILDVVGKQGDWYKIEYDGNFGYVYKDYILIISDNGTSQSINRNIESKPNSVVTSSAINDVETTIGAIDVGENPSLFDTILAAMKQQLGTPYIYGGTGEIISKTSLDILKKKYSKITAIGEYDISADYFDKNYRAFDCSGFMQWGFKQAGFTIGRSTKDQINNGEEIQLDNVKPGDLLFYTDLSHVGMYIGEDKWIEAPNPRSVIRIVSVPWNKIGRARRIIN